MPKLGTKERCVEVALQIAERGFEHVTIAAVAKEIGLTVGAVRYHFNSQAEIMENVIALAKQRSNPYVLGQLKSRRQ